MITDGTNLYDAFFTHDARFDGRVFVGVTSTHIYCRPVCRVRVPKRENCIFFQSAAAAEHAGFRPCMRCKPELAPGVVSSHEQMAQIAAKLIDTGFLHDDTLTNLATKMHVSDRSLRRQFRMYWGVSPVAYAQTQKLLLSKQLLSETHLSITQVAFSAGFASLSRFNTLFKKRYRLSPRLLRKHALPLAHTGMLTLSVGYRPPFAWTEHLHFLAGRAILGVESVDEKSYSRAVSLRRNNKKYLGWVSVQNDGKHARLVITMPEDMAPVTGMVLTRVRQLFDTASSPNEIAQQLGSLATAIPGLRVPGAFDGFEMAVRAILGQQISVIAARTLAGRLASAFGEQVASPIETIERVFPSPEQIVAAGAGNVALHGITRKRAQTIYDLAKAITDKKISLTPNVDVETTIRRLQEVAGIGEWTAHYIAMRALSWPDAFLQTDLGIKKALGEESPKTILKKAEQWQPWRSYAVMYLWNSLSAREVIV